MQIVELKFEVLKASKIGGGILNSESIFDF
jgi:hypothetical protein